MQQLNVVGFETRFGFRTIELFHGDITAIDPRADVLVVSAFAGGYSPNPGSVFGALHARHGIDARLLAQDPELDLRDALGIWLSRALSVGPADRLLCVHLVGGPVELGEALDNVFAALHLFAAKGVPTRLVALPMVGAGHQKLEPDVIARAIVPRAQRYLESALATSVLRFVELDQTKAQLLSDALDHTLGRHRVTLPQATLTAALLADVRNKLTAASTLFSNDALELRSEWIRLLQQDQIRSVEFGVSARKLVELILTKRGIAQQVLYRRIHAYEETRTVAPWICGYMHVLRHLGNESAHENASQLKRIPSTVGPMDLAAGLYCVERLLDFWLTSESPVTP
jgi:O-acetyl-ADP-ribose deacetylase (regulator of RNase III)